MLRSRLTAMKRWAMALLVVCVGAGVLAVTKAEGGSTPTPS
jgi:hypothetical protein